MFLHHWQSSGSKLIVREKGVEDFVNTMTTLCLCFSCEMSPWIRQNHCKPSGPTRDQQITTAGAREVRPKHHIERRPKYHLLLPDGRKRINGSHSCTFWILLGGLEDKMGRWGNKGGQEYGRSIIHGGMRLTHICFI